MAGDDEAELLVDIARDFGDRYAEVSASRVPTSDRYPEGIKYTMQYGNADGGDDPSLR